MRKYIIYCCFTLLPHFLFSQSPLIKIWDKDFGGNLMEDLKSMEQTKDGGFILAGDSYSNVSGDKTQPNWDTTNATSDYWIIKIDSLGNKEWDKRFGGNADDRLYSISQTPDNGYILGGISSSNISGDKTEFNWGNSGYDYWIVKIDSLGNKDWDKRYGGTGSDFFTSLFKTSDGGFILGGTSTSDSTGDKSQPSWGGYDFWIIKIDALGNKMWDKRYGGFNHDRLFSLQQTNDGGYFLGGDSNSDISGDKTQPHYDTICQGICLFDFWVLKIDSLGNKLWDKRFGGYENEGISSLKQTIDGGYVLAGISESGIGGDKTQPLWGGGGRDYWIVKIDSLGFKQWDKRFGGTFDEGHFGNISETFDGGYLLIGNSISHISGDKTENNLGSEQGWIVKTDSLGTMQWDKTIFTSGSETMSCATQIIDNCFSIANSSGSGIGGYKTEPVLGSSDYWIIKFCDSTVVLGFPIFKNPNYSLSYFPNPVKDELSISIQSNEISRINISILNLLGQSIFNQDEVAIDKNINYTIDMSSYNIGVYIIKITIDGNQLFNKIIKE